MPANQKILVLTRVFDAPPEVVFKAWTDPKQVAKWWGPKGFTNPRCEWDARPGKKIRIDMTGPNGIVYPMGGEFIEVDPPLQLIFYARAYEAGTEVEGLVVQNTVTFVEVDGKTRLTLEAIVKRATLAMAGAVAGMDQGWNQSLDRLAAVVNLAPKQMETR